MGATHNGSIGCTTTWGTYFRDASSRLWWSARDLTYEKVDVSGVSFLTLESPGGPGNGRTVAHELGHVILGAEDERAGGHTFGENRNLMSDMGPVDERAVMKKRFDDNQRRLTESASNSYVR
jgi:hypothetical protein